ncbi:hypothetical protein [Erwinia amylovora]|uniref:hypothetical protein n=1 Tax=Erwinia amylovora TaxID=552 RepID=UPI00211F03EC|nr:hypothetical protein [Erwinia amylovora]
MYNKGTFTNPKRWADSGVKGDIYYNPANSLFYVFKKKVTHIKTNGIIHQEPKIIKTSFLAVSKPERVNSQRRGRNMEHQAASITALNMGICG